jgi:hypothetical protein
MMTIGDPGISGTRLPSTGMLEYEASSAEVNIDDLQVVVVRTEHNTISSRN